MQQKVSKVFPIVLLLMFRFLLVGDNGQADALEDIQCIYIARGLDRIMWLGVIIHDFSTRCRT
jgi:hypothetical protein